jgi:hypothetical protein
LHFKIDPSLFESGLLAFAPPGNPAIAAINRFAMAQASM